MIVELKDVKKAKVLAVLLLIAAGITFLVCSLKLFRYSENYPNKYLRQYNASSAAGKALADAMVVTGSVEGSIGSSLSASRKTSSSGCDIFSDISNKHK